MSSRVGTAIPASRSTARSSAAVGLTRSIQTAVSGSAERSAATAFFSEASAGMNTDNMGTPGLGASTQQDMPRLWQALHAPACRYLWRSGAGGLGLVRRHRPPCPQISREVDDLQQKNPNR